MYPVGATSVCCAVCNAVTAVPPPGIYAAVFFFLTLISLLDAYLSYQQLSMRRLMSQANSVCAQTGTEMAQLVCGGCHTLLMYIRGATSVQCSCCQTVNLALEGIGNY